MRDKNFAYGYGFSDQIRTFIAHAHVFMPVITEQSSRLGWVHQEIGYAMALNVPVLPVAVGTAPGEMIQTLQAILLTENEARSNLDTLGPRLDLGVIENLVTRHRDVSNALFVCAGLAEDRTLMMTKHANDVLNLGVTGKVRQKSALSSFHIPDRVITDSVWQKRYGSSPKSPYQCRLQRDERCALEKHARQSGCRLIVDPSVQYSMYGPAARRVRLQCLIDFLNTMPDDKTEVAVAWGIGHDESLTLVGAWFAAEAVSASARHGYGQTVFSRHAPSMRTRIELFDEEFRERLAAMNWEPASSRSAAIGLLEQLVAEIPKGD